MKKLIKKLKKNKMSIIVAIPQNSVEMAIASEQNGADAIKTHINMTHRASKITFGSLEDERKVLADIMAAVKIPVGIVPGASLDVPTTLIEDLVKMGFDFFDMFVHFIRPQLLKVPGISRMTAIDSNFDIHAAGSLGKLGIEMMEAAIIPSQGYGEALSIADLARYDLVRKVVDIPIIVPSQRTLIPEDIPSLYNVGVEGILVGVLSTGSDVKQLAHQIAAFRNAIDRL